MQMFRRESNQKDHVKGLLRNTELEKIAIWWVVEQSP